MVEDMCRAQPCCVRVVAVGRVVSGVLWCVQMGWALALAAVRGKRSQHNTEVRSVYCKLVNVARTTAPSDLWCVLVLLGLLHARDGTEWCSVGSER